MLCEASPPSVPTTSSWCRTSTSTARLPSRASATYALRADKLKSTTSGATTCSMPSWQHGRWSNVAWKAQFGIGKENEYGEPAALQQMQAAGQAAQAMVDAMNSAFVNQHPDYAISLILQQQRLENMFAFSNDELDQLVTTFRDNEDQQGYKALCQQIEQLRRYTRGTPYTDLTLELPDGTQKQLSDYIQEERSISISSTSGHRGAGRAAWPSPVSERCIRNLVTR